MKRLRNLLQDRGPVCSTVTLPRPLDVTTTVTMITTHILRRGGIQKECEEVILKDISVSLWSRLAFGTFVVGLRPRAPRLLDSAAPTPLILL